MAKPKPIPEGYHTVTPYLIVDDGAGAIEYYKRALGATELMRHPGPGGKIMHAEIKLGDSVVMLADEFPGMGHRGPRALGGSPVSLVIHVENVDEVFSRAVSSGAKVTRPVADQFYGDRSGTMTDPFGHVWTITTHIEDVPPEEMERRMKEFEAKQKKSDSA